MVPELTLDLRSVLYGLIHPIQFHLSPNAKHPSLYLNRQITKTTDETMESSWFYWLEVSCQRYWVFIHNNSQTFSDINISKYLWTQGEEGKKQETRSLLETATLKLTHPSWEAKQTRRIGNTRFPGFPKRSSAVTLELPLDSRRQGVDTSESSWEQEEAATLARGDNLVLYRNTFCVTGTR